jgi:hypothetical protein
MRFSAITLLFAVMGVSIAAPMGATSALRAPHLDNAVRAAHAIDSLSNGDATTVEAESEPPNPGVIIKF